MANKKFNFKVPLLDAEGKEHKEGGKSIILSESLSNIIMSTVITEQPMKFFDWALSLKKDGELSIDNEDTKTLKDYIANHNQMAMLLKGRLLQVLLG